jgi:hypothetical protein
MNFITITGFLLASALLLSAQNTNSPVASTVRQMEAVQAKNLIAAAEQMPADKYGYRPTPEQMSFAHLMTHVVESNNNLCARIAGEQPRQTKLSDSDSKDMLVQAMKDSFAYCEQVLAKADDSKLNEEVPLFGTQRGSRAAAFIRLASGWSDHYGMAAMYLRLNGLLPPSARKTPAKD